MDLEFPIHHVLVVGFHHKKGCQVEYAFPPLEVELEKSAWKYLPTLAIPDGAHNFDHDTVYFHLPSLKNPRQTVFGVACYQQIESVKLINRPEDATRNTVQKSVCVLSRYPLFGHIQVKMQLITAAYFREGDFNQVSILEEAFHNLNACLVPELLTTPEAFVGLSPRELVFTFRHQVLILFKLLLLERKILFRGASVGPLCSALLTLVSLLPLTLEFGLNQAACTKTAKTLSVVPQFSHEENSEDEEINASDNRKNSGGSDIASRRNRRMNNTHEKDQVEDNRDEHNTTKVYYRKAEDDVDFRRKNEDEIPHPFGENSSVECASPLSSSSQVEEEETGVDRCQDEVPHFLTAVQMSPIEAGFPLALFKKGNLCHPYLSLHYLDLLADSRVKGFLIGTTNILFKQKKDLVDVIVEMQDGSIEILDGNLKKQVMLTTPDLRFAENIVRQVTMESGGRNEDTFMDGVGWEGGDEWIRSQFKYYLMCAMRTSLTEEGNGIRDSFGSGFLSLWEETNNWKTWRDYVNSEERETPGIYAISPGHPCTGGISVSDVKIRFSHSMQNTEGGRRFNQAVQNTGKAVLQTGKAVGGALTSAKGAFSSWWTNVTSPTPNKPEDDASRKSTDDTLSPR